MRHRTRGDVEGRSMGEPALRRSRSEGTGRQGGKSEGAGRFRVKEGASAVPVQAWYEAWRPVADTPNIFAQFGLADPCKLAIGDLGTSIGTSDENNGAI